MKPYLYETHLHTAPVSRCAKADVRASLEFYKSLGYAGVFITNHFIDGNVGCDRSLSFAEKIEFYFSACEEGKKIGEELGISVFSGVESSHMGSDFLIYGLDKAWYLSHPEIMEMKKSESLTLMAEEGALIIQAHPFREHPSTDRIVLFPRFVHGAEVYNASQNDFRNRMAEHYAKSYELIAFAGSDNHIASAKCQLGGMKSETPIVDEKDFAERVKSGEITPFGANIADGNMSSFFEITI